MRFLVLLVFVAACSQAEAKPSLVGQCVNLSGDEVYRTACPGSHKVVGSLTLANGVWPGGSVFEREAKRCPDAADAYLAPTPERWQQGDRALWCLQSAASTR